MGGREEGSGGWGMRWRGFSGLCIALKGSGGILCFLAYLNIARKKRFKPQTVVETSGQC